MRFWRIVRERHAATAFSGEGARAAAARWNARGTAIAYAAEHLSLAALELFVHVVEEDEPLDLVSVEAEFPLTAGEIAGMKAAILERLGEDWRFEMARPRALGAEFVRSASSALMLVPSVVIDTEWNALINPAHKDFAKLKIVRQRPFRFDPRMFRR